MKIEFGGGTTPIHKEFTQCDIRELPGVDIVCNAWDISQIIPWNSTTHIFSRHFFEHLTFWQGGLFLDACRKILIKGGIFEIIIPNMEYHIKQWQTNSNIHHARAGFWGWQSGNLEDTWDIHKSGYNYKHLLHILSEYGYNKTVQLKSSEKHLHVISYK